MRILFLGNNWVGWKVLDWLKSQKEEVIGLVIHAPEKRKYGEEILKTAGLDPSSIFDGSKLRQPEVVKAIQRLQPEIGISAFFGYLLPDELLRSMRSGCVNIHSSFLPYNRGVYPNLWSIVDGTPAGVSLHFMDEGVDTGDIIVQRQLPVEPIDTGESLYRKLEKASVELFKESWPLLRHSKVSRIPQKKTAGSYHRLQDLNEIREIDLNRTYTAKKLIDRIRAQTFPPYKGAYFLHEGRKVYLRLELLYED